MLAFASTIDTAACVSECEAVESVGVWVAWVATPRNVPLVMFAKAALTRKFLMTAISVTRAQGQAGAIVMSAHTVLS